MKPVVALLLGFTLSFSLFAQSDNAYNLLPFPAQFAGGAGQFTITATTRILVSAKDAGQRAAAQTLLNQLKLASGFPVAVTPTTPALAKGKHIVFQTHKSGKCGPEGYVLNVSPERILVESRNPQRLFLRGSNPIATVADGSV